jgi:hypothetical protein
VLPLEVVAGLNQSYPSLVPVPVADFGNLTNIPANKLVTKINLVIERQATLVLKELCTSGKVLGIRL